MLRPIVVTKMKKVISKINLLLLSLAEVIDISYIQKVLVYVTAWVAIWGLIGCNCTRQSRVQLLPYKCTADHVNHVTAVNLWLPWETMYYTFCTATVSTRKL